MQPKCWEDLPDSLIINILYYLEIRDFYHACFTCHRWWMLYSDPAIWRNIKLPFYRGLEKDENLLDLIKQYGHQFRSVNICLNQFDIENRTLACEAIRKLATIPGRQIEGVTVTCTGENPLFYAGMEFIEALQYFATTVPEGGAKRMIKRLDLSPLPFQIKGECILTFRDHFSSLEYLDIQNKQLVCLVDPDALRVVVKNCLHLKDLRVFYCSLDEDVLMTFAEPDRIQPLNHLSALCRRELKFCKDEIRPCVWTSLKCANANFQVTLRFDHTCPLAIVREVMKPQIPVTNLFLETYTQVYPELEIVYDAYADTLLKLVLQTQMSEELDYSLIQLAQRCTKLRSLHVLCPITPATIRQVLQLLPALSKTEDYTMKPDYTPEPWVTNAILDEIKLNQGLG